MLRDLLRLQGVAVGRRHVATLMRRMPLQELYRKPDTRREHPSHAVFPCTLRGVTVERANQVRTLDIPYIPMARGWVYLVAVLDRASPRDVDHDGGGFCVEALREAAARWGSPEIVNTDQGPQFSSAAFVAEVARIGARQSIGGKTCWRDNVLVERLCRSVKHNEVYFKAYNCVSAAPQGLAADIDFYNSSGPNRSHDGRTPDMAYFGTSQRQADAPTGDR